VFRLDPRIKLNEEKLHRVAEKKFHSPCLTRRRQREVTFVPFWIWNIKISISKGIRSVLMSLLTCSTSSLFLGVTFLITT